MKSGLTPSLAPTTSLEPVHTMSALVDLANLDLASTPNQQPPLDHLASAPPPSRPQPPQAIPTAQRARKINGNHTDVLVQIFQDRVLVIVTQLGRIGAMVRPLSSSSSSSRAAAPSADWLPGADPSHGPYLGPHRAPASPSSSSTFVLLLLDRPPRPSPGSSPLDPPHAALRFRTLAAHRLAARPVRPPRRRRRLCAPRRRRRGCPAARRARDRAQARAERRRGGRRRRRGCGRERGREGDVRAGARHGRRVPRLSERARCRGLERASATTWRWTPQLTTTEMYRESTESEKERNGELSCNGREADRGNSW